MDMETQIKLLKWSRTRVVPPAAGALAIPR